LRVYIGLAACCDFFFFALGVSDAGAARGGSNDYHVFREKTRVAANLTNRKATVPFFS
jgi:hypothetical protein